MSGPDHKLALMQLKILWHKLDDEGLHVRANNVEHAMAVIERLAAAVEYADTRAVSRAAYPHACLEDRKLRDLIDAALGTEVAKAEGR